MKISEIRGVVADLEDRLSAINDALIDIDGVQFLIADEVEARLSAWADASWVPGEDGEEGYEMHGGSDARRYGDLAESLVGEAITLSAHRGLALYYFVGCLEGDPLGTAIPSNFSFSWAQLLSKSSVPRVVDRGTLEPSLKGFTDFEIAGVTNRYSRRATNLLEAIRDIHTMIKKIITEHSVVEDPERHGLINKAYRPSGVLSQAVLTKYLGAEPARQFRDGVLAIEQISRPRDGEPATLDYFSSHTTNRIQVTFAVDAPAEEPTAQVAPSV